MLTTQYFFHPQRLIYKCSWMLFKLQVNSLVSNWIFNKTDVMVMSKQSPNETSISITVNNIKIEHVQYFNYLGSWLTIDRRCEKEIRRRVNLSKRSFNSMKKIFRNRQLPTQFKSKRLKCFVWPVLMYGCET